MLFFKEHQSRFLRQRRNLSVDIVVRWVNIAPAGQPTQCL